MTTLKELKAKKNETATATTATTATPCVAPLKYINILEPTDPKVKLYLTSNGTTVKKTCKDLTEARKVFKDSIKSYSNLDQYTCQAGYLIIFADVIFKPIKKEEPTTKEEAPTVLYDLLGKEVK